MALALTAGLTAGLAGPSAVAQHGSPPDAHGTGRASPGPGARQITLITGDRVVLDDHGEVTGLIRAEGRETTPVQLLNSADSTFVIPADARPLIADGTLDRRLFDVTELSRAQYDAARELPLIVSYEDGEAGAEPFPDGTGPEVTAELPAINGEALTVRAGDAAATWEAFTEPTGSAGQPLDAAPGIATIALDAVVRASLDTSVPQIGAPAAWDAGYDGAGVTIAVLDTGVSTEHPDLAGQVVAAENFSGAEGTGDRYGHGTHVASIAAGTGAHSGGAYTGVAPGARLLNGKVLDDEGFGSESGIIQGMEWAVEQGAAIVNLSLGGYASTEIDPMEEAVNTLSAESDALFVVAAGNSGPGTGTIDSPGTADAALTVGAVDKSSQLAAFSSVGPRPRDGAIKPDVTAPGVDIGAAAAPGSVIEQEGDPVADGYVAISGTSMATPHAAGAAALLAQQHPGWTGEQLKAALTASTTPGEGYTAFQQGSGRIDVASAIEQSVITEEVSLSFGTAEWPHADDQPVTRELTYENLGTEPITLDLAANGTNPGGGAVPEGFFTLSTDQLTVPAGGTATVEVTANTRLGEANGTFSLAVTATGGGHSVRTAGAVTREVESYDLTIEGTDRDGAPASNWIASLSNLETLEYNAVDTGGSPITVRLPAGDYLLEASFLQTDQAGDELTGIDWLVRPALALTEDTTVTLDATDAEPIDVTIPDPEATLTDLLLSFDLVAEDGQSGTGVGWFAGAPAEGMTTAQLGEVPEGWRLSGSASSNWRNGNREYYSAHTRDGGFYTGLTQHVTQAELAQVTARLGASLPGRTGALFVYPATSSLASSSYRNAPRTTTVFVQADPGPWGMDFWQANAANEDEAYYWGDFRTYQAGGEYQERFNIGVFGPKLGANDGLYREGDTIYGWIHPFADGAGHYGDSVYTSASTTLYRNGEEYATADGVIDSVSFEVPPGRADYRLVTRVSRDGTGASVSSRVTAAYTFTSGRPAGDETVTLPASAVRYRPTLATDSTSPAGQEITVPVAVQGPARGGNLASLTVSVSTDGGGTWRELPVQEGAVRVTNPAAPDRGVSFRARIEDDRGNITTQTIIDAYLTR